MTKEPSYLEAVELILRELNRPLSSSELILEIRKRQLKKIHHSDPIKKINSILSVNIKNKKISSIFKRVGKGMYALKEFPEEEYQARPHGRRMSSKDKVLVFSTETLEELGHFHGIRTDYEKYKDGLLNTATSSFMGRLEAEADNKYRYKQIVSYIIIKHKNKILRFTRGVITNIGEYLHGEYSIGFGGHVDENPDYLYPLFDKDLGYSNSLKRELKQEINIDLDLIPKYDLRVIGVLNDDSTELGRRHFAFIHLLELIKLPKGNVDFFKKGEKSINSPQLVSFSEISKEFSGYEYWSKLCLQTFFGDKLTFNCRIHPKPSFQTKNFKKYVLIAGYIGSGKSEACRLLASEFNYTLVPCSKIMQEEIGCASIDVIGRKGLQEAGYEFINSPNGHKRLAKAIYKFIKGHKNQNFVLDGLRYPKTLEAVEKLLKTKVSVIYVESSIDSLYRYFTTRENSKDIANGKKSHNFSEFLEIVYHPVEREIERFYPGADVIVYNHGSKDDYLIELKKFFNEKLGTFDGK